MKYLKSFRLFEKYADITLYHGGLEGFYDEETKEDTFKKFTKFHKKTSYFSDNPVFAMDYADLKTTEGGYDADIYLYTCKFKGNLFDYRNEEDFNKLMPLIPEETRVTHGTFWFMDHKFSKEEMIKALKGIQIIKPCKFADANIGDEVPNPVYSAEMFIVVDKDDDKIYTISKRDYFEYRTSSAIGWNEHFSSYTKFKDIFEPWRKEMVDTYNRNTGSHYEMPKYSFFQKFYQTYQFCKKGYQIDYVGFNKHKDKVLFSESDMAIIDKIYDECASKYNEVAKKELHRTEWNRKVIDTPMESNWNFYETSEIEDIIKKLGYDGYIALEDKHRTYAIYQPDKTVDIIKTERMR